VELRERYALEKMVVDAVLFEPVSSRKFHAYREINRETR